MKHMLPLLVLIVAACGAQPAPQFFGATRSEITLEGIRFVVFRKEETAEVIRMGYLSYAARAPVPRLMEEAVLRTTGCRPVPGSMVTGLPGDTGEARFRLDCPG